MYKNHIYKTSTLLGLFLSSFLDLIFSKLNFFIT